MKAKTLKVVAAVILLMGLLGPTGAALADEPNPFGPDTVSGYTFTPSTVLQGETFTIRVEFDASYYAATDWNHFCFYMADQNLAEDDAPISYATWTQGNSSLGDSYTEDADDSACPDVSGYDYEVLYSRQDVNDGVVFGDAIDISVALPSGQPSAGSYLIAVRQYNGTNGNCSSPNASCESVDTGTKWLTVQAWGSTVYVANDTGTCAGNSPCVTGGAALNKAIDNIANNGTIWVMGSYDLDTVADFAGGNNNDITIRGSGSNPAINNDFGNCTSTMIEKNGGGELTVRDLTIDGLCCGQAGTGVGIDHNAGTLDMDDVTVQNFPTGGYGVDANEYVEICHNTFNSNGTGVRVTGSTGTSTFYCAGSGNTFSNGGTGLAATGGTVDVRYNTFDNNSTAGIAISGGTATIGNGPGSGNTIQNGGIGINHTGGTLSAVKGNTITGNSGDGMYLTNLGASPPVYGNRVTGNSGDQIQCTGASPYGAGYNWIGYAASNANGCSDTNLRLGANWVTWVDNATSLNQVTLENAGAIFDLGGSSNPPFGNGVSGSQGLGQLVSNFYVIREGTGDATFSPTTSGRLYRIQDVTQCSTSGDTQCWDYEGTNCGAGGGSDCTGSTIVRDNAPSGHYVVGQNCDPTALTLDNITAQSPRQWLPMALAIVMLVGVVIALAALRRRQYL